ncbi:hypothetical protein FIBSPDRAFT_385 [Athelia psychrophila]|uniref:Uncharacterized protein n=1 Tax=Athelia psychrophila TaxID=1759441 RepID=A0A166WVI1_9AGAM|nr:hypothetical protein FIBSPDRAFT_385 [Fibularhizoctonia sp. CBS 109695]
MLVCLAAECTATYSLSKYEYLQTNVETAAIPGAARAQLHNDDLIAAECIVIVFSVFVATLFGADFFFLLFFPRRVYPRWYNMVRKTLAVGITAGVLAGAVMSSVVVARSSAFITGVDDAAQAALTAFFYRPPLRYSAWPTNIAFVVLTYIGFLCTAASTVLMFRAAAYDARNGAGPLPDSGSAHASGAGLVGKERPQV